MNQAMIMGEIIRSRGLATAVGVADAAGHVKPSYCASACVLVFAGGKTRFGVEGSALGVHRFVTPTPGRDPVAETQRTAGTVLSYMTKMGVSSAVVEAMSETRDVRWLEPAAGHGHESHHRSRPEALRPGLDRATQPVNRELFTTSEDARTVRQKSRLRRIL